MSKDKRSFFEKLTGAVRMDEEERELPVAQNGKRKNGAVREAAASESAWSDDESDKDAELTVDVYHTPEMIVVKSMIAGVRPEDLDVSITRDSVTIRGKREEERVSEDDDFLLRELYWGSFSRTVSLPEEIDVDEAEAIEKHGLLILKLPKLDKRRLSKLKVKTV
jgi:HSP20 family protein